MKYIDLINEYILSKAIKQLIVIEIVESKQADVTSTCYNLVYLSRNKKEISLDDKLISVNEQELTKWIELNTDVQTPILLVFNSYKVLYKIINNDSNSDFNSIVKENFPSINTTDFWGQSQITDTDKQIAILCIARINAILPYLENQKTYNNNNIIYCTLGPSHILQYYKTLFNPDKDGIYRINFRNFNFHISDKEIIEYNVSNDFNTPINEIGSIGNNNIPSSLLIAYAYGLSFFVDPVNVNGIRSTVIDNNKNEFFFKKTFKIMLYGVLTILFLLLFTSSIVYTIYQDKYNLLQQAFEQDKSNAEIFKIQKQEFDNRNNILEKNGLAHNYKVTYVADNITKTLPNNIFLKKVSFYPEKKKVFDDENQFDTNTIVVTGTCYSGADLETWIEILKKLKWIDKIGIKEFRQIKSDDLFDFTLEIIKHSA